MSKINLYNRTIRIGKLDWEINVLPEDQRDELHGRCSVPIDATIEINPELESFDELDTLLHETLHAIDSMRQLDLTEELVGKLGHSLATLFVQNPWMITYINNKVKEIIL
jgi:hypothetical protein